MKQSYNALSATLSLNLLFMVFSCKFPRNDKDFYISLCFLAAKQYFSHSLPSVDARVNSRASMKLCFMFLMLFNKN